MLLRALPGLRDYIKTISAISQLERQIDSPYLVLRRRERGRVRCSIRLGSRFERVLEHALSTLKVPAAGELGFMIVVVDVDSRC